MPLHSMLYYDLEPKSLIVNPCRDQNYRKYFEMRKKYGLTSFMWQQIINLKIDLFKINHGFFLYFYIEIK